MKTDHQPGSKTVNKKTTNYVKTAGDRPNEVDLHVKLTNQATHLDLVGFFEIVPFWRQYNHLIRAVYALLCAAPPFKIRGETVQI